MKDSILIGLLQNIAILLSFSMLYECIWIKDEKKKKFIAKLITGIIIGAIGIVLMFTPWTLIPGIAFDTRSIMLSISGLFFGAMPTLIAMLITGIVRFHLGGAGVWMGIAVILFSGIIGILWRQLRPNWRSKNYILELLLLGLLVHAVMLSCVFFLPVHIQIQTLKIIAIPLFFIYLPATVLLGALMVRQANNWQNKQAKEKLKEIETQFNRILKSGNIASVILDDNFTITFCNNFFLEKTHFSLEEIRDKNWFELFIDQEEREYYKQNFERCINENQPDDRFDQDIKAKDGEIINFSWHISLMRNKKNKLNAIACIGVDITERIHYENNLKEKNKELHIAKEKAEESDRLKSAFLANLSHEIRTPMNAILGFSELLKSNSLTAEKRDSFITIIHNKGQHLLTIINDIVEMSKIDTGLITPTCTQIEVNSFIENVYNFIKNSHPIETCVEFILEKPTLDFSPILYTDEKKLNQIVTNLLVNAIKFTHKGFIKFGYKLHENNTIELYVEDTGIGIDPKYHTVIFERFRQVDDNAEIFNGGSGLGLAISKAYANLLGTNVLLKSETNKGSTFSISFPLMEKKTNTLNEQKKTLPETANNQQNDLLLIVEDDNFNYMFFTEVFAESKYKIIRACNGLEAVDLCNVNKDIRLVLMDLKMPIMNGYDAVKLIKKQHPTLPVIAQTAHNPLDLEDRIKEAGFDARIMKPINTEELFELILNLLAH